MKVTSDDLQILFTALLCLKPDCEGLRGDCYKQSRVLMRRIQRADNRLLDLEDAWMDELDE
jgi:hypothetical protein